MSVTPKLRSDLTATPLEEEGVKYFDVNDPRSGARMRLFDFEWQLASQLNGARAFGELASWAQDRLGITPTADDIETYAARLAELGFFDGYAPAAQPAAPQAAEQAVLQERTEVSGEIVIETALPAVPTTAPPPPVRESIY